MKPTEHPLQKALEARVRLLETTLQPSTVKQYRRTVRLFLGYLSQNFPEVQRPSQLSRAPHALGWLEYMWKLRTPTGSPLDSSTRGQPVLRLRTLLDLLADLPQPPRPGLLCGPDVPPRQYRLPRPLSPEDDARLQQLWTTATDVLSSALLLQRLTGMRIGECVDLPPDGLRHLGDNRWSLHVPHGKPRSERWVPVDDQVRVVIERLTFVRTLPPAADPQFLLARPKGRDVLLASLRQTLCDAAAQVGIQAHLGLWPLGVVLVFELLSGFLAIECPIDRDAISVGSPVPGAGFRPENPDLAESALPQTLLGKEADLQFRLIQPTSVYRRGVNGEPISQRPTLFLAEAVRQRLLGVGTQVVHDQMDGLRSGIAVGDGLDAVCKFQRRPGRGDLRKVDSCLRFDAAEYIGSSSTFV